MPLHLAQILLLQETVGLAEYQREKTMAEVAETNDQDQDQDQEKDSEGMRKGIQTGNVYHGQGQGIEECEEKQDYPGRSILVKDLLILVNHRVGANIEDNLTWNISIVIFSKFFKIYIPISLKTQSLYNFNSVIK